MAPCRELADLPSCSAANAHPSPRAPSQWGMAIDHGCYRDDGYYFEREGGHHSLIPLIDDKLLSLTDNRGAPVAAGPRYERPVRHNMLRGRTGSCVMSAIDTAWHVATDGASRGPLTLENLVREISEGKITADTLVWRTGWSDWARAGDVEGLFRPPPVRQRRIEPAEQLPQPQQIDPETTSQTDVALPKRSRSCFATQW